MRTREITESEAEAIVANAPSRQVRRALQRRVLKNNRQYEVEVEMGLLKKRQGIVEGDE